MISILTALFFFIPAQYTGTANLKIPAKLFRTEGIVISSSAPIYTVDVTASASGQHGLNIGGVNNWENDGWPMPFTLYRYKVKEDKKYTELELRCDSPSVSVKIRYWKGVTLSEASAATIFDGSREAFETSPWFQDMMKRRLATIFTGELSKIPLSLQHKLVRLTNYQETDYLAATFKGKLCLEMTIADTGIEYNTLKVTPAERVAGTFRNIVLPRLRAVAGAVEAAPAIYGIKLRVRVRFRDFLRYGSSGSEWIEIYAPYDATAAFANQDITDQKLADACVVLVDGNRVDVKMELATTR